MTNQRALRQKLLTLQRQQQQRIEMVEGVKRRLDETVIRKQREIENLQAQVTIRGLG